MRNAENHILHHAVVRGGIIRGVIGPPYLPVKTETRLTKKDSWMHAEFTKPNDKTIRQSGGDITQGGHKEWYVAICPYNIDSNMRNAEHRVL
jgi:hypothetical protein